MSKRIDCEAAKQTDKLFKEMLALRREQLRANSTQQLAQLQQENDRLSTRLSKVRSKVDQLVAETDSLRIQLRGAQATKTTLDESLTATRVELEDLKQEHTATTRAMLNAQDECCELKRKVDWQATQLMCFRAYTAELKKAQAPPEPLKPCPNCLDADLGWSVICYGCGTKGPDSISAARARYKWNTMPRNPEHETA